MEARANFFSQFVKGGTNAFALYCTEMRKDGCWGDNPEIQAMCELYGRMAEIFEYDQIGLLKIRHIVGEVTPGGATRSVAATAAVGGIRARVKMVPATMRLIYHEGHYDSLVNSGDSSAAAEALAQQQEMRNKAGNLEDAVIADCLKCHSYAAAVLSSSPSAASSAAPTQHEHGDIAIALMLSAAEADKAALQRCVGQKEEAALEGSSVGQSLKGLHTLSLLVMSQAWIPNTDNPLVFQVRGFRHKMPNESNLEYLAFKRNSVERLFSSQNNSDQIQQILIDTFRVNVVLYIANSTRLYQNIQPDGRCYFSTVASSMEWANDEKSELDATNCIQIGGNKKDNERFSLQMNSYQQGFLETRIEQWKRDLFAQMRKVPLANPVPRQYWGGSGFDVAHPLRCKDNQPTKISVMYFKGDILHTDVYTMEEMLGGENIRCSAPQLGLELSVLERTVESISSRNLRTQSFVNRDSHYWNVSEIVTDQFWSVTKFKLALKSLADQIVHYLQIVSANADANAIDTDILNHVIALL